MPPPPRPVSCQGRRPLACRPGGRAAMIPLSLPDDIADLLDTVAPLHGPEVAEEGSGPRPATAGAAAAAAATAGPGTWWTGARKGAAGLRRALRQRRGTPAPWRSPVEGVQASAAASEAER